jgi:hypothetical protein
LQYTNIKDDCDAQAKIPNNKKILVVDLEMDTWLDCKKGEKSQKCVLSFWGNPILGRFFIKGN